jgi:DNA-binding PadR family transcriptional regulator
MNATRLFVLGSLANGGPMHGHQIRLAAQVDRTELWADVKPGSLYGALRRMASEGVIETVRTEQKGNRPERTIYQITEAGRAEFKMLRDKALRDTRIAPDSVNLALLYCGDLSEEQTRAAIELRRQNLAAELASWEQLHTDAAPWLTGLEPLGFEHQLMRIKAEIAWHDLVLERLPKTSAGRDGAGEGA